MNEKKKEKYELGNKAQVNRGEKKVWFIDLTL